MFMTSRLPHVNPIRVIYGYTNNIEVSVFIVKITAYTMHMVPTNNKNTIYKDFCRSICLFRVIFEAAGTMLTGLSLADVK